MRHIFSLKKTALLGTALLAATASQVSHAQDATINITGQISASTCIVAFTDPTTGAASTSKTINFGLGTINGTTASAGVLGSTFGTAQSATFSVKDSTGTTTCTLGTGNTAWDLSLGLGSSQITTVAGNTVLTNSVATTNGGTNAAVILKGVRNPNGVAGTPATLSLVGGGTNYVSGSSSPAAAVADTLTLTAQFVKTSATGTAPSNGVFNQTIPVTLAYK